jgi:hypothetical protein
MHKSPQLSRLLASTLFAAFAIAGQAAEPAQQVPTITIPDSKLLSATFSEMMRASTPAQARDPRDKLVAYARDISHDEKSRTMAIDFLSAIKSEENYKLLASFLNDSSDSVRTRAYYGLPRDLQSSIGDYDYTRQHSNDEFRDESARINKLIEAYVKATNK